MLHSFFKVRDSPLQCYRTPALPSCRFDSLLCCKSNQVLNVGSLDFHLQESKAHIYTSEGAAALQEDVLSFHASRLYCLLLNQDTTNSCSIPAPQSFMERRRHHPEE